MLDPSFVKDLGHLAPSWAPQAESLAPTDQQLEAHSLKKIREGGHKRDQDLTKNNYKPTLDPRIEY